MSDLGENILRNLFGDRLSQCSPLLQRKILLWPHHRMNNYISKIPRVHIYTMHSEKAFRSLHGPSVSSQVSLRVAILQFCLSLVLQLHTQETSNGGSSRISLVLPGPVLPDTLSLPKCWNTRLVFGCREGRQPHQADSWVHCISRKINFLEEIRQRNLGNHCTVPPFLQLKCFPMGF